MLESRIHATLEAVLPQPLSRRPRPLPRAPQMHTLRLKGKGTLTVIGIARRNRPIPARIPCQSASHAPAVAHPTAGSKRH